MSHPIFPISHRVHFLGAVSSHCAITRSSHISHPIFLMYHWMYFLRCSIVVENADSCSCWFNMPTFKSNSLFIRAIARLAALVKIPSRVTTFVEMAMSGSRNGTEHALPLRNVEGEANALSHSPILPICHSPFSPYLRERSEEDSTLVFVVTTALSHSPFLPICHSPFSPCLTEMFSVQAFRIFTCNVGQEDCAADFSFSKDSRLKLWRGAPPTIAETLAAASA